MNKKQKQIESTHNGLCTLFGVVASNKVKELISDGWEFTLHYGEHDTYCEIKELSWEADFTRKKVDGGWDNHKCGYALLPDDAIKMAYDNIKNGVRLTKRS
jgi:hypothetical protein